MEPIWIVLAVNLVALVACAAAVVGMSRWLLYVVPPHRLLVFSGRATEGADGTVRGYRCIRGGRAFRIPGLEQAHWLELQPARFSFAVPIDGLGDVVVSGSLRIDQDQGLHAAIERYLDQEAPALLDDGREPVLTAVRVAAHGASPTDADLAVVAEAARLEAEAPLLHFGLELEHLSVTRA